MVLKGAKVQKSRGSKSNEFYWDLTLLQSIFSRQIFLLYFGKGKFGGKKFTLQKSEFYFAKEFFPFYWSPKNNHCSIFSQKSIPKREQSNQKKHSRPPRQTVQNIPLIPNKSARNKNYYEIVV
jgi:hypothetical protein